MKNAHAGHTNEKHRPKSAYDCKEDLKGRGSQQHQPRYQGGKQNYRKGDLQSSSNSQGKRYEKYYDSKPKDFNNRHEDARKDGQRGDNHHAKDMQKSFEKDQREYKNKDEQKGSQTGDRQKKPDYDREYRGKDKKPYDNSQGKHYRDTKAYSGKGDMKSPQHTDKSIASAETHKKSAGGGKQGYLRDEPKSYQSKQADNDRRRNKDSADYPGQGRDDFRRVDRTANKDGRSSKDWQRTCDKQYDSRRGYNDNDKFYDQKGYHKTDDYKKYEKKTYDDGGSIKGGQKKYDAQYDSRRNYKDEEFYGDRDDYKRSEKKAYSDDVRNGWKYDKHYDSRKSYNNDEYYDQKGYGGGGSSKGQRKYDKQYDREDKFYDQQTYDKRDVKKRDERKNYGDGGSGKNGQKNYDSGRRNYNDNDKFYNDRDDYKRSEKKAYGDGGSGKDGQGKYDQQRDSRRNYNDERFYDPKKRFQRDDGSLQKK